MHFSWSFCTTIPSTVSKGKQGWRHLQKIFASAGYHQDTLLQQGSHGLFAETWGRRETWDFDPSDSLVGISNLPAPAASQATWDRGIFWKFVAQNLRATFGKSWAVWIRLSLELVYLRFFGLFFWSSGHWQEDFSVTRKEFYERIFPSCWVSKELGGWTRLNIKFNISVLGQHVEFRWI